MEADLQVILVAEDGATVQAEAGCVLKALQECFNSGNSLADASLQCGPDNERVRKNERVRITERNERIRITESMWELSLLQLSDDFGALHKLWLQGEALHARDKATLFSTDTGKKLLAFVNDIARYKDGGEPASRVEFAAIGPNCLFSSLYFKPRDRERLSSFHAPNGKLVTELLVGKFGDVYYFNNSICMKHELEPVLMLWFGIDATDRSSRQQQEFEKAFYRIIQTSLKSLTKSFKKK